MKSEFLKIFLHVLSPLHAGSGEVYEPTEFFIDETRRVLRSFQAIKFIEVLSSQEKKRFGDICMNEDLLGIFKFIRGNAQRIEGKDVEVPQELVNHYKKILGMNDFRKDEVINQFTLLRTSFNPHSQLPFIPGSALKGALRTAYLNLVADNRQEIQETRSSSRLEGELLGGTFAGDPFSHVKTSDLQPVNEKRKIVYALNRKKEITVNTLRSGNGPYQILEIISPKSVFEGTIQINIPTAGSPIRKEISFDNLFNKAVWSFFRSRFKEEQAFLGPLLDLPKSLGTKMQEKKAFLIRIGRHSGAEAVTIERIRKQNRTIKIMKGRASRPEFGPCATTVWLASDSLKPSNPQACLPFGWAVLEIVEWANI